jgi:hypothetical protein
MKVHPTTTLTDKHGDQVEIDTKIAALMQRLWDMELTTVILAKAIAVAMSGSCPGQQMTQLNFSH